MKANVQEYITINFYKTGKVVIQGQKCTYFVEKHFEKLKEIVSTCDNIIIQEPSTVTCQ